MQIETFSSHFLTLGDLIPHYYYVPKIYLEKERKKPHSQVRLPSDEDGGLFLWGQSLLIIMNLLCNTYNSNYRITVTTIVPWLRAVFN